RSKFLLSPATAAVWYQPERNSITIPLGILTPPYYDSKYPQQINYAGAGAVIGHEYWRGFDDEGAQFDWEGRLADCSFSGCSILDTPSQQGFNDMAESVYDQFMLQYTLRNNNELWIFDQRVIFWMSYGASMCTKMTDERLKDQLTTGTQAPSSCQVNQAIQDIPQFGEDFMCKYK
ncbi:hypothetical protein PENTCL1PPCAC_8408, partial [Pristionchus entomophagus]